MNNPLSTRLERTHGIHVFVYLTREHDFQSRMSTVHIQIMYCSIRDQF